MVGAGDFNVAGSLTHKNSEHRHKGGRSNSDNQNSVRCRSVVAGASCSDLVIFFNRGLTSAFKKATSGTYWGHQFYIVASSKQERAKSIY